MFILFSPHSSPSIVLAVVYCRICSSARRVPLLVLRVGWGAGDGTGAGRCRQEAPVSLGGRDRDPRQTPTCILLCSQPSEAVGASR